MNLFVTWNNNFIDSTSFIYINHNLKRYYTDITLFRHVIPEMTFINYIWKHKLKQLGAAQKQTVLQQNRIVRVKSRTVHKLKTSQYRIRYLCVCTWTSKLGGFFLPSKSNDLNHSSLIWKRFFPDGSNDKVRNQILFSNFSMKTNLLVLYYI